MNHVNYLQLAEKQLIIYFAEQKRVRLIPPGFKFREPFRLRRRFPLIETTLNSCSNPNRGNKVCSLRLFDDNGVVYTKGFVARISPGEIVVVCTCQSYLEGST